MIAEVKTEVEIAEGVNIWITSVTGSLELRRADSHDLNPITSISFGSK